MNSISRRLLVYLLCAFTGLLAMVGGSLYFAVNRAAHREFDRDLQRETELLAAQVNTDDAGQIRLDMTMVPGRFSSQMLIVLDNKGDPIYESANSRPLKSLPPADGFHECDVIGEPYRTYSVHGMALPDDDEPHILHWPPVPFRLVYAKSTARSRRVEHLMAYSFFAAAIIGGVLATIVIAWVVRSGLAPLNLLGEQLQRLDANSLKEEIRLSQTPSELQFVIDRMNGLMRRLNDAFERQKRFTANAAHEFRTPIAEIRATAEVALQRPWLEEKERASFEDVLASASRMQSVISTLLCIARGGEAASIQPVDIFQTLDRVIGRLAHVSTQDIRVCKENDSIALAVASPEALEGIFFNLLTNALEYRSGGDPVDVHVDQLDDHARVRIANSVTDDDLEQIGRFGEQFWRSSQSRSAANHSGLGCALAKMYASAMGGRVTWEALRTGSPRIVAIISISTITR